MSIKGKRASTGKTEIIALVATVHEFNILGVLETSAADVAFPSVDDPLAMEIRALR